MFDTATRSLTRMLPLALATLLAGDAAVAQNLTSNFRAYPTVPAPRGAAVGDLNGDSHNDIVVGRATTGGTPVLAVHLSNGGSGFYRMLPDVTLAFQVAEIVLGHANLDGNLDVFVVGAVGTNGYISVLHGDGAGGLMIAQTLTTTGTSQRACAAKDLDGDGDADLVTGTSSGTVQFYRNIGGTLALAGSASATGAVTGIDIGSLDGDALLDVVVCRSAISSLRIMLDVNLSPFTWTLGASTAMGSPTGEVRLGDIDGDAHLDIAVATSTGVSLRLGNGAGGLAGTGIFLPAPISGIDLRSLDLGDLDADGDLDLAYTTSPSSPGNPGTSHRLFVWNGPLTAGPSYTMYSTGRQPNRIRMAHLDNDGHLDIVTSNQLSNSLAIHRGDGVGGLEVAPTAATTNSPTGAAFADLDADGDLDVVARTPDGLSVSLGNGDGTFVSPVLYHSPYLLWSATVPASVSVGDVDGDGDLDVVTGDVMDAQFTYFPGNGDGTFGVAVPYQLDDIIYTMAALADIDGDDDLDVLSTWGAGLAVNRWDAGGFIEIAEQAVAPVYDGPFAVADVDGVNGPDIVATWLQSSLLVAYNDGTGSFANVATFPLPAGGTVTAVMTGDLNGDGAPDVAVSRSTSGPNGITGNVVVSLNDGSGAFPAAQGPFDAMGRPDALVIADLGGDGLADVAAQCRVNSWVSVLAGDGTGGLVTPASTYGTSSQTLSLAAGDVDGDGATDLMTVDHRLNAAILLLQRPAIAFSLGAGVEPSVAQCDNLAFMVSATSAAGGIVLSMDSDAPPDATFNPLTGEFSWTPGSGTPPGDYAILFRAMDAVGFEGVATVVVHVTAGSCGISNQPPVLALIGDQSVDEMTPLAFAASANDPDASGSLTFALVAGAQPGMAIDPGTGAFSWTPTEEQGPASYAVTVRVTDGGSPEQSDEQEVLIHVYEVNRAPVLAPIPSATVDEGSPFGQGASAVDPDAPANAVNFSFEGSVPAGLMIDPGTGAMSWTPTEAQGPGSYTITVRATDDGDPNLYSEESFVISINEVNQPPVLAAIAAQSGAEGDVVAFVSPATDDDLPANTLTWSLVAPPAGASIDPGTGAVVWNTTDNGLFMLRVRVEDGAGGAAEQDVEVQLSNVDPTPTIVAPAAGFVVAVGTAVTFSGSFADPGSADSHTALWSFDAINVAGSVDQGANTTEATHSFSSAGVYRVTLTVTDDDGGSGATDMVGGLEALVVVYDPNGGFVTGGGWIQSPVGAYAADPPLTGKANFGFVSKYQRGTTVPTGETEFHFNVAGMKFRSTAYEWLVVSGSKAQYKGRGTINGLGDYGFMLTAVDGALANGTPDKLRMKIWDRLSGNPVYDNQLAAADDAAPTTVLGGGSVVIHTTRGNNTGLTSSGGPATEAPAGAPGLPQRVALSGVRPNPVVSQAVIAFELPRAGRVVLALYDATGRLVRNLVDDRFEAGRFERTWDARDGQGVRVSPGVYFGRLDAVLEGDGERTSGTAKIIVR